MKYPIIVHSDSKGGFSASVPDFPGCFTAGDTLEELTANVQEAVELYLDGEDMELPAPTPLEEVLAADDAKDGAVLVVDVDLSFLDRKAVPVNITMPVYVRNTIDRAAKARGLTRSAFMVESAMQAAGRRGSAGVL